MANIRCENNKVKHNENYIDDDTYLSVVLVVAWGIKREMREHTKHG